MKLTRLLAVALGVSLSAPASGLPQDERFRVGLDGRKWSLIMELPGFQVIQNFVRPDGRRYFYASNSKTGVNASITLQAMGAPATLDGCKKHMENIARQNAPQASDTESSERDRFVIYAYTLREFQGVAIRQRFFRACTPYDDTYADFNFSKVQFQRGEEKLFLAILDTIKFEEVPEPPRTSSTMDYWLEGSAFFRGRDYTAAIGPYSRALELEKKERKLEKVYWYVLVDNLGMAYGITGDLKKAKETFEYGIGLDPSYPLFYYNLACTFAEMGDKAGAMEQLVKAFDRKANVLPGERIPDPRKDDSFQRFMKDADFKSLAERLAKSR